MSAAVMVWPIRTPKDYEAASARAAELIDAAPGTPGGDEFEILADLIEAYDRRHAPIGPLDPRTALEFHMDRLGLKQADLVAYLGARSRVSEVLAGRRKLTLRMVQKLHEGLGIPLEALIG